MEKNNASTPREIVRYARLSSLTIYEVSEDELNNLEHGTPAPLLLSFALFLLGVAVTGTITMSTIDIQSTKVYCAFMIFTIIGYIVGAVLSMISIIQFKKTKSVGSVIRQRANATFAEAEQITGEAEEIEQ